MSMTIKLINFLLQINLIFNDHNPISYLVKQKKKPERLLISINSTMTSMSGFVVQSKSKMLREILLVILIGLGAIFGITSY